VNDGNAFILRLDLLNRAGQYFPAVRVLTRTVFAVFFIHTDLSSFIGFIDSFVPSRIPAENLWFVFEQEKAKEPKE
jgi:hypothetical protein